MANAQLVVNAPTERLLHWLAHVDWDVTIFSEKIISASAAGFRPDILKSQSFFAVSDEAALEQTPPCREKVAVPMKRTKCNLCDKFCPYSHMCSLSCGHYFCKGCWISAIVKAMDRKNNGLTCLFNTCVHDERESSINYGSNLTNSCVCSVESDFVSFLLGDTIGTAYQRSTYHLAEELFSSRKRSLRSTGPEFRTLCRIHDNNRVTFRLPEDYSYPEGSNKHVNSFANRAFFLLPDLESFAVYKLGEYMKSVQVVQDSAQYWHLEQLIDGWNLIIVAIKLISTSLQSPILRYTAEVVHHLNYLLEATISINSQLQSTKAEQLSTAAAKELIAKYRRLITRLCDNISCFYRVLNRSSTLPGDAKPIEHALPLACALEFGDISYGAVNIIPSHIKRRCGAAYFLCRDLVRSLTEWASSAESSCLNDFSTGVHLLNSVAQFLSDGQAKNLIKVGLTSALVSTLQTFQRSEVICFHICQVVNKICSTSSACGAFLKILSTCDIWTTLCNVVSTHLDDVDVARSCYRVMVSVLEYMECNGRSSLNEQVAANCNSLHTSLQRGLQVYKQNEVIIVQILKVFSVLLEKCSSSIIDMCINYKTYEPMLECMRKHFSVDGMKVMFTLSVGRIASAGKLMQEKLKDMQVYETLIDIVNEDLSQYTILKFAFWALGCLVQFYPTGQSSLAAVFGACGAYSTALQRVTDLPTTTVILSSLTVISAENELVRQALMEENILQVLLERRDHFKTLFLSSHSAAQKNLLKKLFLTCDSVMDSFGHKANNYSSEESNEITFIVDP